MKRTVRIDARWFYGALIALAAAGLLLVGREIPAMRRYARIRSM